MEKNKREEYHLKLISWNVNGLRSAVNKGFLEYFYEADADLFSLQETKLQEGQLTLDLPGYFQYWNYAEKKGILEQQFLVKKNLFPLPMALAFQNMIKKVV